MQDTLNLAVQKEICVQQIASTIGHCRKLVIHFHRSRVDTEELQKKQEMLKDQDVRKNKLIMVSSNKY